jgi:hypothetical protein
MAAAIDSDTASLPSVDVLASNIARNLGQLAPNVQASRSAAPSSLEIVKGSSIPIVSGLPVTDAKGMPNCRITQALGSLRIFYASAA